MECRSLADFSPPFPLAPQMSPQPATTNYYYYIHTYIQQQPRTSHSLDYIFLYPKTMEAQEWERYRYPYSDQCLFYIDFFLPCIIIIHLSRRRVAFLDRRIGNSFNFFFFYKKQPSPTFFFSLRFWITIYPAQPNPGRFIIYILYTTTKHVHERGRINSFFFFLTAPPPTLHIL